MSGLSDTEISSTKAKDSQAEDSNTEDLEALDALFRRSARYRSTGEYKRFLDFVSRITNYSPYNAALLHVQNPGVTHVATRRKWRDEFGRDIEPDARPYVILKPFGPVMLVYDAGQTVPRPGSSPELPDKVTDPLEVKGCLEEKTWNSTLESCSQERVAVREDDGLHVNYGGRIEANRRLAQRHGSEGALYLVTINSGKDLETKYVALTHELAHLFLGHLGADEGAWWESRTGVGDAQEELEAQSVAYLVARRAGLHSVSERYLHWYVEAEGPDEPLSEVRMRQVLEVVRYIEEMAEIDFVTDRDKAEGDTQ